MFLIASPVSTEAKGDIDSRSVYVGNVRYFLQYFCGQFVCLEKFGNYNKSVLLLFLKG